MLIWKLSGRITDSLADFETIDKVNHEIRTSLPDMLRLEFFRYFKVRDIR